MGAWGTGNLENDGALDWTDGLESEKDIEDIFNQALTKRYYHIETGAIAAGEVVAALGGLGANDLPDNVKSWLKGRKNNPKLTAKAITTIEYILKESEIKQLWDDTPNAQEWQHQVQNLLNRLNSI